MNDFIVYWTDGRMTRMQGIDIADAFTKAGYGAGAVAAVDFYDKGTEVNYFWNKGKRAWAPLVPVIDATATS